MSESRGRALLLVVSLLAGLVFAEIVLRLFVEQETKRLAAFDRDLGWTGRPNGEGWYVRRSDGIREYFVYNELGFRDEKLKETDSPRVLFLGDSFQEGLEVPYTETFHEQVEQRLKEEQGHDVDVVSVASQGYSTAQQLRAYRKFSARIKPDMVVLMFYTGNDLTDNLRHEFAYLDNEGRLVIPDRSFSWFQERRLEFVRWVYESSHLVFLLKNTAENVTRIRFADESKKVTRVSDAHKVAITDSLIALLYETVREDGKMFAVVVIPSAREIAAGKRGNADQITGFCRGRRIPVVDLSPFLSRGEYFPYDEHLNGRGHRVVADTLIPFVMQHLVSEDSAGT